MKGVSDIIAVLLMLIITIGLAGLAYSYISGIFTSRTAVVLSIDSSGSTCSGGSATISVRNDGSVAATNVHVDVAVNPQENPTQGSGNCADIGYIPPGGVNYTTCTNVKGVGVHLVRVYTSGSSATGTIYCTS